MSSLFNSQDPAIADAFMLVCDALTEIEQAGYVLVKADRWERVREAASIYQLWLAERCGEYQGVTRQCLSVVSDDDLDVEAGA